MGRPTSYNPEEVLLAAVALFRAKGYQRASVDDLVQATGLNRFALYEKFGGKEGLFYDAIDYYHGVLIRQRLLEPLFRDDACLDTVVAMLQSVRDIALDAKLRSGCLIINANTELGGADEHVAAAAEAVMESFRLAVSKALGRAHARGELRGPDSVLRLAGHVSLMIQAFFALAYISRDAADQLMGRLVDEVTSWRQVPVALPRLASPR